MPRFFDFRHRDEGWRGRDHFRDDHFRDDRWREHHDEPHPGFPFPPLPPLFEREYGPGEQEAERYHRPRWSRQQGGEGEFEPAREEYGNGARSGRWVRHRGRLILLGV